MYIYSIISDRIDTALYTVELVNAALRARTKEPNCFTQQSKGLCAPAIDRQQTR